MFTLHRIKLHCFCYLQRRCLLSNPEFPWKKGILVYLIVLTVVSGFWLVVGALAMGALEAHLQNREHVLPVEESVLGSYCRCSRVTFYYSLKDGLRRVEFVDRKGQPQVRLPGSSDWEEWQEKFLSYVLHLEDKKHSDGRQAI